MKKKLTVLAAEDDLLEDLIFNNVLFSLLVKFVEKIIQPCCQGNLNVAIQDLIQKAFAEQIFHLFHITHVENMEAQR
jgi:hypothetical protein